MYVVDDTDFNYSFLRRDGWTAKANLQYGRSGPISLFAVNRREEAVAVFVGNCDNLMSNYEMKKSTLVQPNDL